jgi:hypothetical protein
MSGTRRAFDGAMLHERYGAARLLRRIGLGRVGQNPPHAVGVMRAQVSDMNSSGKATSSATATATA